MGAGLQKRGELFVKAVAQKEGPVNTETIIIVDFGTPYTQVMARRIRNANVYCKILPDSTPVKEILAQKPQGIILSGDWSATSKGENPGYDAAIFQAGLPVLGFGSAMALMQGALGGKSGKPQEEEGGLQTISLEPSRLLAGLEAQIQAEISRGYGAESLPPGFSAIAYTDNGLAAAMENEAQQLYALAFYPEQPEQGRLILHNFLFGICGCRGSWRISSFIEAAVEEIRQQVGEKSVLLGLSGGVDSSVAAALLHKAVGEKLVCVFVDHGLLRKNEREEVEAVFKPRLGENLIVVDAGERFLSKLAGITDPEQKRKIIGGEFIAVFSETARSLGALDFLAQGTIYPDIIESGGGNAAVIKSHHNVGGLPEDLPFCGLVEPLRYLFKDEVRKLGEELGLPKAMVWRQPFPGPGLAIRIIGDITRDKLAILREADAILRHEIAAHHLDTQASQYFPVLTGLRSVGIKDNQRSYDYTLALRVVNTTDFMTADWVRLPHEVLDLIAQRIINEVPHVNRIVYDITGKPPASIEWE